jgi:hypothetical protein
MLLYRSLVVGLLAANLVMLAHQQRGVHVVYMHGQDCYPSHRVASLAPPARVAPPTIVDVSPLVPHDQLLSLVHLQPGEQITSVDSRGDAYTDVTLRGARGERRVLLLVH